MPSSLTRVLSRALGFSPRPPESVYSTITKEALCAAFLGSVGLPSVPCKHGPHHLSALRVVVCPYRVLTTQPTGLNTHNHAVCWATLLRPRLLLRHPWRCRNINLLSITYAFRPRLRIRLTLGGLSYPRKPWAYGDQISHLVYRYSCLHKLFSRPRPVVAVRRVSP